MPYITGSRLKVKRAGRHLNELERKVGAFLRRHPDRFSSKLDKDDLRYVIYDLPPVPAPPNTFGPIVGDIVHNLRSALDHIAWNLALRNLEGTDTTPYDRTAFPILDNIRPQSIDWFYRCVQDVLPDAIPIIEELQPDHGSDTVQIHPLVILNGLWNGDKHRVNTTIPARQYIPEFTGPDTGYRLTCFDDGTRQMRVPIWSDPKKNLEPHIRSKVLFEIPDTALRVDLVVLRMICEFVRDVVLPPFAGFLPESTGIVERQYGRELRH